MAVASVQVVVAPKVVELGGVVESQELIVLPVKHAQPLVYPLSCILRYKN